MKKSVAVMDFGTSKITVLIGRRGINNSICIDGLVMFDYDGYSGGQWLAPELLGDAVSRALTSARETSRQKIEKLYIGVPGDFITCDLNDVAISLGKKRRIIDRDVDMLHAHGNLYSDRPDVQVINIQPIYYKLDNDHKLVAPVGMTASQLGGRISYIQAYRDSFISPISEAVSSLGIPEIEYIAAPLAETMFLFDDYRRDNCVILADVGAYSTSLTVARGDGILSQYHFPWGGNCITYTLADALKVTPRIAEKLKRSVSLTIDPDYVIPPNVSGDPQNGDTDNRQTENVGIIQTEYSGEIDKEPYTFNVYEVNSYVQSELGRFARYIDKALKSCVYDYPEHTVLSVTGGGLCIRGAEDYLSDLLKRKVELIKPDLPLLDDPAMSSVLGVMDMALSSEEEFAGATGRLRRWFNKR